MILLSNNPLLKASPGSWRAQLADLSNVGPARREDLAKSGQRGIGLVAREVVAVDDTQPVSSAQAGTIDPELARVEHSGIVGDEVKYFSPAAGVGNEQLNEIMTIRRLLQPVFGGGKAFGQRNGSIGGDRICR